MEDEIADQDNKLIEQYGNVSVTAMRLAVMYDKSKHKFDFKSVHEKMLIERELLNLPDFSSTIETIINEARNEIINAIKNNIKTIVLNAFGIHQNSWDKNKFELKDTGSMSVINCIKEDVKNYMRDISVDEVKLTDDEIKMIVEHKKKIWKSAMIDNVNDIVKQYMQANLKVQVTKVLESNLLNRINEQEVADAMMEEFVKGRIKQ